MEVAPQVSANEQVVVIMVNAAARETENSPGSSLSNAIK